MMSSSVSNDNNDTDKDEFGKKIKHLTLMNNGKWRVRYDIKNFSHDKTHKTKLEALEEIKKIEKMLDERKSNKNVIIEEKIQYLTETNNGTWRIRIKKEEFNHDETYKTKDDALKILVEINRKLEEIKNSKVKVIKEPINATETDTDEFGKKIPYLKKNTCGTFTVHPQKGSIYNKAKTYKTKTEALEMIELTKKDLERISHTDKKTFTTSSKKKYKVKEVIKNSDPKIIVSPEHEYLLTKYSWSINKQDYARGIVDEIDWIMHRYIMIIIQGNNLTNIDYIDHINGIRYDNRIENLRIGNASTNSQNRTKKKGTSSKYYNVSKNNFRFCAYLTNTSLNLRLSAQYEDEIHAAWQVNLWIDEYNLVNRNKNDIEEPQDFKLYVSKKKELPKYITKNKNSFKVSYKRREKTFKTLEEAKKILNIFKKEYIINRVNEIKSKPILRNSDNYAIFQRIEKGIVKDIIVDDKVYYKLLINGTIGIANEYAIYTLNCKKIRLHRYLMNQSEYDGTNMIDHINGNKLDNRIINLRVATPQQNSQNRLPKENASSQYTGVCLEKESNKWIVQVTINKKNIHVGRFDNEEYAARIRDTAILEYYGEFGTYNFPIECYTLYHLFDIFE